MPIWQESLWHHLPTETEAHLVLRGFLLYDRGEDNELQAADRNLVCRLDQPLSSSTGVHGIYLKLAGQDPPVEAQALLLTPGMFARIGESGSYPEIQIHTLAAPLLVLQSGGLRLEAIVRKAVYEQSEPADLLQRLSLEVVIWKPLIPD
ncbi:MAG: hypothetical protein JXA37_12675 [Chloroflexia bacterium]|nr:hypothetical protein [Chloroflexia bacterium]